VEDFFERTKKNPM